MGWPLVIGAVSLAWSVFSSVRGNRNQRNWQRYQMQQQQWQDQLNFYYQQQDLQAQISSLELTAAAGIAAGQSYAASADMAIRLGQANLDQSYWVAEKIEEAAKYQEEKHWQMGKQMLSSQKVAYTKKGVTMEGTPTSIAMDTAAQIGQDAFLIRQEGNLEAAAQKIAGHLQMAQAHASAFQSYGQAAGAAYGAQGAQRQIELLTQQFIDSGGIPDFPGSFSEWRGQFMGANYPIQRPGPPLPHGGTTGVFSSRRFNDPIWMR